MKYTSQSHESQRKSHQGSEQKAIGSLGLSTSQTARQHNHGRIESYMARTLPVHSVFIAALILMATFLVPLTPAHAAGGPCLVETVYELWHCTNDSDIEVRVARVKIFDNPYPDNPTFIHCGPSGELTTIWQDEEIVLEELVTDIELLANKMTILTDGSKLMVFGNQPIGYNGYRGMLVQPLQSHLICTSQDFPPETW